MSPILGIVASQDYVRGPIVTGGTLFTSGGYNYRLFTASGTLGISGGTLSCDVLCIAGGAGGEDPAEGGSAPWVGVQGRTSGGVEGEHGLKGCVAVSAGAEG